MADPEITRAYLESEVDRLEPFGFLAIVPTERPLDRVEVRRAEDGSLSVSVPGRPPVIPPLDEAARTALREAGLECEDAADASQPWTASTADPGASVALAGRVLREAFDQKPDSPLDVLHGSSRAEHEAKVKLEALRRRVEGVLSEMFGELPKQDADEDYLLRIGEVQVVVAPRAIPGGPAIVRVFAVTNVSIAVVPELGLFLARLNFGLMFGRFALDTENQAIWFDETLLGDQLNEEALRFAIRVVAETADGWDDRLKQMFGGLTHYEVLQARGDVESPTVKPGEAGSREGTGLYL
ncbi:MAG: YbjN domain-containing protein [Myxococcota bacterium]|nr:YbjN domain-containing protein [Myxococcota bacterium]